MRKDLTYDLIAEKCQALFAAGKHTSFDAVYDLLDRQGSGDKVRGFIKEWRQNMAAMLNTPRASAVLPEELVSAADNLIQALWVQALDKADSAYSDRNAELDKDRIVWSERLAAAEERADSIGRQLAIRDSEVATQNARIADLKATLADVQARLTAATSVIVGKEKDITALQAVANEANTKLANLARDLALRNHELQVATDALASRDTEHAEQLAAATGQADQARTEAAEARGRAALLAEQLAALQAQVAGKPAKAAEAPEAATPAPKPRKAAKPKA